MYSNVKSAKMKFIDRLCPPALLYLVFVALSVGLDVSLGLFLTAAVKAVLGVAVVVVLDAFCSVDLGVVSWFIVAAPFVVTALATAISMGLDADTRVAEHFQLSPASVDDKSAPPKTVIADDVPISTTAM
jgi:hypothetical protein